MNFAGHGITQRCEISTMEWTVLVYATADEADAYMFTDVFLFFLFFLFLFFFRSPQKYQTTVLGTG